MISPEVSILIFCVVYSIGLVILGYAWGGKNAIAKFLAPTCGMSVKHNQYSGEVEAVTYYYSDRAYQEKIKELKYQDCEEILNEGNNETLN